MASSDVQDIPPEPAHLLQHAHHHLDAHHLAEMVADRRGLTAIGGASIAVGLGLIGAIIDVSTGDGLRVVFGTLFIIGCLISAAAVHVEDLMAAVIMPPLAYLLAAFVGSALDKSSLTGGWFRQQSVEMASNLVLDAPVLIIATVASVAIAFLRHQRAA